MDAIELFRQFQTLIVGVVGFTGVIITLAVNARLARKQHERQIQHDSRVLRIALRAELSAIAETYRDRIKSLSGPPGEWEGASLTLDPMTDFYKRMIDRVGLLSSTEIRLVRQAYALAQQLPEHLTMFPGAKRDALPGTVWLPARHYVVLKTLHQNYLHDVDAAVGELTRGIGDKGAP